MGRKKRLTLFTSYLYIGLVPMIIAATIAMIIAGTKISSELETETYNKLKVAAEGLQMYYAWDIINTGEAAYEHDYVDALLSENIEQTLFLEDVRYITSLKDDSNPSGRNEGTKAAADIWAVVKSGSDYHADNVTIGNGKYYVYYVPVKDGSGTVVGMGCAATPQNSVKSAINSAISMLLIATIILMAVLAAIIVYLGNKIKKSILAIIGAAKTMADGNMNEKIECESGLADVSELIDSVIVLHDKFDEVVTQLGSDVTKLNSIVTKLNGDSANGKDLTTTVSEAIDGVAIGAAHQAESTQEAQLAVVGIGESIDTVSAEANTLSDAITTMNDIRSSTVEAMNSVLKITADNDAAVAAIQRQSEATNDSAQAISKAVEIITSIAAQTNLLSLNASIEAARAGEAGKGFAVVADEIRDLADQSSASASEITDAVNALITQANNTLEQSNSLADKSKEQENLVRDTRDSFNELGKAIDTTSVSARKIGTSVAEIDTAKDTLVRLVEELSSISEENAASAEETTASAQILNQTLETMDESVQEVSGVANGIYNLMSFFKK